MNVQTCTGGVSLTTTGLNGLTTAHVTHTCECDLYIFLKILGSLPFEVTCPVDVRLVRFLAHQN